MISLAPSCLNSGLKLLRTRAAASRSLARLSFLTPVATGVMMILLPSRLNDTSLPGRTPAAAYKPAPPDMAEIMFATNQMLPAYVRRAMVERKLQNDDVIARLHVPILLLAGDKDLSQPAPLLTAVAARLAHGRLLLVPDAGHAAFIDAPEAFERELRQFAASAAPR